MSIITTDSKHYNDIARAIREKTGGSKTYTPSEMAGAIRGIESGGYDEGYEAGQRSLDEDIAVQSELIEHIADVLENKAGTFYDAFWDAYQENGNITDCRSMFAGKGWTNDTFKPKHTVKPKNAERMFYCTGITDLKLSGVVDFSSIENMRYFLAESICVSVDVINLTNATDTIGTVYYNPYLKHIGKIVLKDDGTTPLNTNTFQHCYPLETIEEIVGTIGFPVDFSYSAKLTHDSLMSIINHLKDYSGTGTTRTVTLGATNLAKLTDDEKAIATRKGWTLA